MRNLLTLALAASLASFPLAGVAVAQTPAVMADDMLTIVNVGDVSNTTSDTSAIPQTYLTPSPETIAKAQTEIQNDPVLAATLTAKNVQFENVIGIQTAANGGKVVYLK